MPIYDIQCKDCDEIVEALVRSYEAELPKCTCGGENKRLISTPSFMFAQPGGVDNGRLMQVSNKKAKRS